MRYWIGIVLALLMLVSNTAHSADSQSRASRIADEISPLSDNLNTAERDLLEMRLGILAAVAAGKLTETREYQALNEILWSANEIESFANEYELLIGIYSLM